MAGSRACAWLSNKLVAADRPVRTFEIRADNVAQLLLLGSGLARCHHLAVGPSMHLRSLELALLQLAGV